MIKMHNIEAQNPLILRCHRLMEAFAKSDDERQFYLDKQEGFLVYIDLDKSQEELDLFEKERLEHPEEYCLIPKMTFYETKKLMENFVTEKVYDIDTKEKLLDIIQSKEARENFLEFIFDHHVEYEKWQQFYQERSRIQIIEWLRSNHFHFVFEEDLDLEKELLEKVKQSLFELKVTKEVLQARAVLLTKAKSYYSNEALHPRPKRGRPPKQAIKLEVEQLVSRDLYTTVSSAARPFLFTPDSTGAVSFSSKFDNIIEARLAHAADEEEQTLEEKLSVLRALSNQWVSTERHSKLNGWNEEPLQEDDDDLEVDEDEELVFEAVTKKIVVNKKAASKTPSSVPSKAAATKKNSASEVQAAVPKKTAATAKTAPKAAKAASAKKSAAAAAAKTPTEKKSATAPVKTAAAKKIAPAKKEAPVKAAPAKKTAPVKKR
jgi:chemotaxis protein histidine kinase CheA